MQLDRIRFIARVALIFALATIHGSTAAAEVPEGPPVFSDPLDVTNPYAPIAPGEIKVYGGKTDEEKLLVVDKFVDATRLFVWDETEIETWILEEIEFEDGVLVEISYNYFAQGDDGALYYFGEVVDIYNKKGKIVSHDGSWLVGGPTLETDPEDTADAPAPALFMPGDPEVGDKFKPEDLFPLVDETVRVKKVGLTIQVPGGKYHRCIKVKETTAIEPDEFEFKWYCRGIGVVLTSAEDEILKMTGTTILKD